MSIIRHAGVVFEGEQGRKYASAVQRIVEACSTGLHEVGGGDTVCDLRDCILIPDDTVMDLHRMKSAL